MISESILPLSIFYNILMFSFLNKNNKKIPLLVFTVLYIIYGVIKKEGKQI